MYCTHSLLFFSVKYYHMRTLSVEVTFGRTSIKKDVCTAAQKVQGPRAPEAASLLALRRPQKGQRCPLLSSL